jgi:hypothetical protein
MLKSRRERADGKAIGALDARHINVSVQRSYPPAQPIYSAFPQ